MVIARKVEFQKLFVFGRNKQWAPTSDEFAIIGGLFDEYNDFCTHSTQNYKKAWVNKDTNHIIFDVSFEKIVGDVDGENGTKYEVDASIIIETDEPNDKFNCHFFINRYEALHGHWIWKESMAVSTIQVGANVRVEDLPNAGTKKAKSTSNSNA